ncbi:hypothetical protein ORD22_02555 [Sporosarcina sp. GW1-11]|uniref:hypothetical protein n=1 Tax=Sporosarcina sp. GW1-11 TaxID=2899126 RepID=UPI00294CB621|nr:hypothetical protein [Sporosarcina sp. GW1-11]MDV6377144.1 hypothetical protein [Sporosarcina sp. GW1-11]
MSKSKILTHDDSSGFEFAKEMLAGEVTAAINFDRIQKNSATGEYIIFEYLLCEEAQTVNPHTSHPNRYWHKNKRKFLSLWEISCDLEATLFLVNYAKKGTTHEEKILVMKVLAADINGIETENWQTSRDQFSKWFREQNAKCL